MVPKIFDHGLWKADDGWVGEGGPSVEATAKLTRFRKTQAGSETLKSRIASMSGKAEGLELRSEYHQSKNTKLASP